MSITSTKTADQSGKARFHSDEQLNILVGIPAYNEEVSIGSVVLLAKTITDHVLVIDDGSTDATADIAREAGATVICHEENQGKGAAVQTIFTRFQKQRYDAVVLLDGDGQHLPGQIRSIAEPVLNGKCDIVIGSRYIQQDRTETPLYRRFGQKVLDYATAGSSGAVVSDSQSGFRAFSPSAIDQLSITTNGYGVESQIISEATNKDLNISEVPINVRYDDVDGQTYNPLSHGLSVLTVLLQLILDRHPLAIFCVPGLFLLVLGGTVVAHGLMVYQPTGTLSGWRIVLSGFALVVGALSLISGLVLHQVSNTMDG